MSSLSGSRKCHVVKKESEEFEFFLTSDEDRHGQIITSVTKDGPASRGGLKDGDRILEINGVNVEKKDHGHIVSVIRDCIAKNEITFIVIDPDNDPNYVKPERPARQSSKVEPRTRLCKIKKKNNSFGFFLERDSKGDFIKQVTKGGASDGTGLKQGDRLIAVGKKNVEKLQHKQVVEAIKASGNKIVLLVIDEQGFDYCKENKIPITEKMVRGSTSSRSSSSSSTKDKSPKKSSTKPKQQPAKDNVKSRINPHKGKVRVVHLLKHPSNGYGFYLRSVSNAEGEFIGKIDADSSAELAGLYQNDRVVAVNGKSIMQTAHADVITLIKAKQSQVVLIVVDEEAMKHFEEKPNYPETDDIVLTYNPAIRNVKLTKGADGYGMFLKVEKNRPSFHILTDINESGVAGQAGLKNGEIVIAVNGKGVLKDDHAACVQKIKDAGDTVELTVGSSGTCEFVSKSNVEITLNFIQEWPTEDEFKVPPFGKAAKTAAQVEAVAEVVEAVTKKEDEKLGMRPRLCHVVRGAKGYGFVLKEGQGHFLVNIEDGSPAFQAGILEYDRIVEVNGENVDNSKHSELVGKIRASGDKVTFLVVNKEEDTFFKEKGIPITSALLEVTDDLSDDHKPRLCKLVRKSTGYGFHLTGEPGREGQFIKEVQKDSAAEEGGLQDGDRIIEVNGKNVIGEGHDDIVKKVTENKEEVTFLVIDKEGDTYYKLKGVKIVASMIVAKEVIEEIRDEVQEHREDDEEERKSVGQASAASSVIETEATVHVEAETDHSALKTVAAVVAVEQIADKVEEIREDDEKSTEEDQTKISEEVGELKEELKEEKEEDRRELLEDVVKVGAVAAVAGHVADRDEDSDDEEFREGLEETPDAEEVRENIEDKVDEIIEEREEAESEEKDGLLDHPKAAALVTAAVVANAVQEDDAESQESSRPPTPTVQVEEPVLDEETKEEMKDIIEDHVEASEDNDEHLKAIAAAAVVVANEISENGSNRDDDSVKEELLEKKEDKDEKDEMKAAAALVHQEILEKVKEKEDSEPEEPEPPKIVKPAAVVVVKATSPPPSPVVVQKPASPRERQDPVPLAVVLTANGDIPKLKPTSPPPANNEPKIIWGQTNLRPITKQISVGSAASQQKNDEAKADLAPVKMSTVAALKAEIERRNRQQQAAAIKNSAKDELAELSKQQGGGAMKHAALFGGSVKKPQSGGPKKNPWVGEGMTIKIIET